MLLSDWKLSESMQGCNMTGLFRWSLNADRIAKAVCSTRFDVADTDIL